MEKGFNKRMSDKDGIPEMNGTIKTLVELIATPLDTPGQQAQAIRDSIKLQLHTYMMQKQSLEEINGVREELTKAIDDIRKPLNTLLEERKSLISKFVDKWLFPFVYFVLVAVLWLVFTNFKP